MTCYQDRQVFLTCQKNAVPEGSRKELYGFLEDFTEGVSSCFRFKRFWFDWLVLKQRIYDLYKKSMPGVSQETQKYLQQDFIQKLNEANISQEQFMTNRMQNNFADGGRAAFCGCGTMGASGRGYQG